VTSSRPEVYTPARRPYAHQEEAARLWDLPENEAAFALFMGMRTGKSKVVLDKFGRLELAGRCAGMVVLAPGGVYKTWTKAIYGDPAEPGDRGHLSEDLRARVLVHEWTSGSSAKQKALRAAFLAEVERPRILLMNIEALSSVKEAREFLLTYLKSLRGRGRMGVIDESIIIKNHSSIRTKFVNDKVAEECDFRVILSGLPNPKDPLDYFSQMAFLDWRFLGFKSWYAMRGRYAIMWQENIGGRMVPIIKGWRDLEDLERKITPHCYRKKLSECYDTPPKVYEFIDVEMTPEQARIYRDLRDYATAELDAMSHVTATVVIAQITRLRQVLCGFTLDELGVMHSIPENRTQTILDKLLGYDGKAVIWCAFKENVERMAAALRREYGDNSVSMFYGGNTTTREHEEMLFKADAQRRWMVATADAGGRGRTWSVADLMLYHSRSDNLDHADQSEERGSAIDKTQHITVGDCHVPGTVETKIIKNLRNKIDLATAVNGEGYRAWLI
jgi:hypothetical protein